MNKVLYITVKEVPYRTLYFNELSKKCDLKVVYETSKSKNRNEKWAKSIYSNNDIQFLDKSIFGKIVPVLLLLKIIFGDKYDEIIFGSYNTRVEIFTIIVLKLFRVKYSLNLDGDYFFEGKGLKKKIKRLVTRGATKYLIAGEQNADKFKKIFNCNNVFSYRFSSLTESEIRKNLRESNKVREDYVLIVGQYFDYKGLDIALDCAKLNSNIKYKIIGTGYRTELLCKLIKEKDISNVEVISFLQKEELYEEYKKCHLLVLPSRKECWGLVINEAASFGTAVVSTYGAGAANEFLRGKYDFFLAKPNDSNDLYNKIISYYEYSKKEEYSKYLIKKSKNYTVEKSVEDTVKMINA